MNTNHYRAVRQLTPMVAAARETLHQLEEQLLRHQIATAVSHLSSDACFIQIVEETSPEPGEMSIHCGAVTTATGRMLDELPNIGSARRTDALGVWSGDWADPSDATRLRVWRIRDWSDDLSTAPLSINVSIPVI